MMDEHECYWLCMLGLSSLVVGVALLALNFVALQAPLTIVLFGAGAILLLTEAYERNRVI